MKLKYNIVFKLRPYGNLKISYQIQMHVTFNSQRIKESTGCQLSTPDAWDATNQVVVPNYSGPKGETALSINNVLRTVWDQMDTTFMTECGEKNSWTKATFQKMDALKEDLLSFKSDMKFSDLTEEGLTDFVKYLSEDKRLRTPRKKKGDRKHYDREDIVGVKNTTINKKMGYLKWFMKWATEHGFNTNMAYRTFHPALKMTQKKSYILPPGSWKN